MGMAEVTKKKQTFKKFTFRGVELEDVMKLTLAEFMPLLSSTLRRKLKRGLTKAEMDVIKACKDAHDSGELYKEKPLLTKARDTPVVNFMVGHTIGIYNGCGYMPVEIKPEMLGNRLKHYAPSKNSQSHGKPGVGAAAGTKFVPLH